MGQVLFLLHRREEARAAIEDKVARLLRMLALEVGFIRGRLDGGICTVGTSIRLFTRVPHPVAAQTVVVGCPVVAGVARVLVASVLAKMELQAGLG